MAQRDFASLYYQVAGTLTSDTVFDGAPATRILGADRAPGFSTVFTALGSRFDIRYVAGEAFSGSGGYEADLRAIDGVPVADALRYARGRVVAEAPDALTDAQVALVRRAGEGLPAYQDFRVVEAGHRSAPVAFLASPAHIRPEDALQQFLRLAAQAGYGAAFATTEFGDAGALALALDARDAADAAAVRLREGLAGFDLVVTDDAYVLDALLVLVPDLAERALYIDEFVADAAEALPLNRVTGRVAVHESGLVERLYPLRAIDYPALLSAADVVLPARNGADAAEAGYAGGLGLASLQAQREIAVRRAADLAALGAAVVTTPDAAEARALTEAGLPTRTLLDLLAQ